MPELFIFQKKNHIALRFKALLPQNISDRLKNYSFAVHRNVFFLFFFLLFITLVIKWHTKEVKTTSF